MLEDFNLGVYGNGLSLDDAICIVRTVGTVLVISSGLLMSYFGICEIMDRRRQPEQLDFEFMKEMKRYKA